MSRANVEIVRRHYDLWNEGHGDPEAAWASTFLHEEIEWIEPPDSLDAAVYRGRGAVVAYLQEWVGFMGESPLVVEELVTAGDEVVAHLRMRLRGSGSGASVPEAEISHVLRLLDGRIDRVRVFLTRQQALEAVGLRG